MNKTNDYVDNKALLQAIKEWQAKRDLNPDTPLCNVIGKAILDISNNLVRRWNFSGYTPDWKEQMVGDGIEAAIKCVKSFDTENYSNPHAYITTTCFRAFQNRIKLEREGSVVKYKYFVEEVYDADCADLSALVDPTFYQDMVNKIAEYDDAKAKAKAKAKSGKIAIESDLAEDDEASSFGLGKIYGKDF